MAPEEMYAARAVSEELPDAAARAGVVDDGGSRPVSSVPLPRETDDSSGPVVGWATPATPPVAVDMLPVAASNTLSGVAAVAAAPSGRPTVDVGGRTVTAARPSATAVGRRVATEVGVHIVAVGEDGAAAVGEARGSVLDSLGTPTVVLEAGGAATTGMSVAEADTSTGPGQETDGSMTRKERGGERGGGGE